MTARLLLAGLLTLAPAWAAPLTLFVAPHGRDTAAGTSLDAPFATLERARDELRARRAAGALNEGATVYLRGGLYELAQPFRLEPEDSGAATGPITWAAWRNERPVISGGRRLTGWRVEGDRWTVKLPEVKTGWRFSHLFVDGQRRFRPRLPEQGYYFINAAAEPTVKDKPDRFRFRRGDLRADWSNLTDVEVHVFHVWSTARLPIASIDDAGRVVNLAGPTWHAGLFPLGPPRPYGGRYLVENVKEALRKPGQWYLDRPTGVLTYLPLPGERPDRVQVVAPRLERVLEVRGDVPGRRWVHHVTFRGLTFAHTNWVVPPKGWSVPQAEFGMGAGLDLVGARDVQLERCVVAHGDAYGIELGQGCRGDAIVDCELADLGAGGVKIGAQGGDDEAVATGNEVRDCLIAHGGRMHPAAVGVWIGYARDTRIEHCDIRDYYYSGISCGWSWGYGNVPNRNNVLEANHIWDTPQQVLGDMGGIYTLGRSPGSAIRGNLIHGQDGRPWGVGIYLDEGSSGWTIENNLVYDASTHVYHTNYGRGNVARYNIFAFGGVITLGRNKDDGEGQDLFERNLVAWREGELLGKWAGSAKFDRNLYWPAAGQAFTFAGLSLEAWRAKGQDTNSLVADPGFVDPAHGDFRLKPGSPAEKLGFQPFDVSKAGRLPGPVLVPGPFPRVWPPAPLEPPAMSVSQDYEALPVGAKDDQGETFEDSEAATARVTEEAAAGGKRSLKFTDAAGQKQFYNPHVYYSPGFKTGRAVGSFDLRLEAGASFDHGWRDNANPFHVGAAVHIDPEGRLKAGGQELLTVPHGAWLHLEVSCVLGEAADGTFDLAVTLPGQAPKRFTHLKGDPQFRALTWYGFVSDGTAPGTWYLDNVELKQAK